MILRAVLALVLLLNVSAVSAEPGHDGAAPEAQKEAAAPEAKKEAVSTQLPKDVILRAMLDELDRSMKRLKLSGLSSPYFISYQLNDSDRFEVSASLGALTQKSRIRWRNLDPTVLCGDYSFDSSNFITERTQPSFYIEVIPVDDDYDAFRRKLWLVTDTSYKNAVEALEEKKAYFKRNNVKDKLDDFTREVPEVDLSNVLCLNVEEDEWVKRVKQLSAVFHEFPNLQLSQVTFQTYVVNRWFVNSEGSRIRDTKQEWLVTMAASTQAADGEELKDYEVIAGASASDMPPYEKMEALARGLAERLTTLASAPVIEDYEGPVLFEGQAAAQFFEQVVAEHVAAEHHALSASMVSRANESPFAAKIGKRILPKFISVSDDPFARKMGGTPILGGYTFDNQGVRAQRVTVVAKGVLKSLCTDRTPSKFSSKSNGHSNGSSGSTSVVFVTSDEMNSKDELYRRLKEMGVEAEVKYVLVARRLKDPNVDSMLQMLENSPTILGGTSPVSLPRPVMLYRLWLDSGKEELVRGASFGPTTVRILKDIQAAGGRMEPHLVGRGINNYTHVICPSILIRDVEVESDKGETKKPPILPNPLAAK